MKSFHLILAALSLLTLGAGEPPDVIRYKVTPDIVAGDSKDLIIEVRFTADPSGRTRLELPDHGGADKDWWKLLSDLRVDNAVVQETSPEERVLVSKPSAQLVVTYKVSSGYDHDPTIADGNPYKPIIRPTWFQVLGERAFVAPKGREKAAVRFSWGPLPAGWSVASDLEHRTPQTVDGAESSLLIGGADVRVIERRSAGGDLLRLAYRGRWAFSPDKLADKIADIGVIEDQFWREGAKPYLVSLIPLKPLASGHSSGGRGLSEAFALFEEPTADLDGFTFLLAHERLHAWIPDALGGLPDEHEALNYWFSEGFTDFYASRLLLRAGIWSRDDFLRRANALLARYWTSNARNVPNKTVEAEFHDQDDVMQLPYDRGWLLAALWDYRLRQKTGGAVTLDAAMLRQRAMALENDLAGGRVPAAVLFPQAYRLAGGDDLTKDLRDYVDAGATIVLPTDLYGDCAGVGFETIAAFDRGFDGAKSAETGVITGVEPEGPAYAAGLRDGMKRLGREDGPDGDSRREIGYRVSDAGGAERLIRYLPAGKTKVRIEQIEPTPGLNGAKLEACSRRMSGGS